MIHYHANDLRQPETAGVDCLADGPAAVDNLFATMASSSSDGIGIGLKVDAWRGLRSTRAWHGSKTLKNGPLVAGSSWNVGGAQARKRRGNVVAR